MEEATAQNKAAAEVPRLTHILHRTLPAPRHQTIPTASTGVAEASMAAVVAVVAIMAELLQVAVNRIRRYQKAWYRLSITDSKPDRSSTISTTREITELPLVHALARYRIRISSQKREQLNKQRPSVTSYRVQFGWDLADFYY